MTDPRSPTGRALFVEVDVKDNWIYGDELFTAGRVARRAIAMVEDEAAAMERKRLRVRAYGPAPRQALYGPGRAFADWLFADPESDA